MSGAKKVVQSKVDSAIYAFFIETAKLKRITLTKANREALRNWIAKEGDLSWDPFFDPSWGGRARVPTDASKVNNLLYGRQKL
jgi:hypothetical protein